MTQTPTHPTHPSHPTRPTLASPSSHPSRPTRPPRVDALQYCAWSEEVFRENLRGGLSAVHATVCYHENFRESAANIGEWREMFRAHSDLIFPGRKRRRHFARAGVGAPGRVFRRAKSLGDGRGHFAGRGAAGFGGVVYAVDLQQSVAAWRRVHGGAGLRVDADGARGFGGDEPSRTRRGLVSCGGADLHGGDCVFGASGCDYARAFGGVAFVAARGFVWRFCARWRSRGGCSG